LADSKSKISKGYGSVISFVPEYRSVSALGLSLHPDCRRLQSRMLKTFADASDSHAIGSVPKSHPIWIENRLRSVQTEKEKKSGLHLVRIIPRESYFSKLKKAWVQRKTATIFAGSSLLIDQRGRSLLDAIRLLDHSELILREGVQIRKALRV